MTEQNKDYSKLRPFDLEEAKRGEPICDAYGNTFLFIAEAGEDGEHAIRAFCGNMALCEGKRMRMKPLAWVEDKPVYKGDVLYLKDMLGSNGEFVADSFDGEKLWSNTGWMPVDSLFWNPPTPLAKRKVTLHAWLDEDGELRYLAGDQVMLKPSWCKARVPSEDKTVEVAE